MKLNIYIYIYICFKNISLEKPELQLSSSMKVFDSSEQATLQCKAVGGYPPVRNLTVMKNDQVILNRASDKITYTTSGGLPRNVYGLYDCIASNTAGTVSETILLQNKGDQHKPALHLVIDTNKRICCKSSCYHLMIIISVLCVSLAPFMLLIHFDNCNQWNVSSRSIMHMSRSTVVCLS